MPISAIATSISSSASVDDRAEALEQRRRTSARSAGSRVGVRGRSTITPWRTSTGVLGMKRKTGVPG